MIFWKFWYSEIREYCSINITSLKEFCHSNSFSTKPDISFTRPWYFYYHSGTFRTRPWYEKMKTELRNYFTLRNRNPKGSDQRREARCSRTLDRLLGFLLAVGGADIFLPYCNGNMWRDHQDIILLRSASMSFFLTTANRFLKPYANLTFTFSR